MWTSDGVYTFADNYIKGNDFTAPDMTIGPLPFGSYSINIGPVQGCSFKNFNFTIGPCVPLAFTLQSFTASRAQQTIFNAQLSGGDELAEIFLQGSVNGQDFNIITSLLSAKLQRCRIFIMKWKIRHTCISDW
jgi:hypothetical protein